MTRNDEQQVWIRLGCMSDYSHKDSALVMLMKFQSGERTNYCLIAICAQEHRSETCESLVIKPHRDGRGERWKASTVWTLVVGRGEEAEGLGCDGL